MAANSMAELSQHLASKHLCPTTTWLQGFLSTARPNTPLPALKQTAGFRLLAADITSALDRSKTTCFPSDILTAPAQSRVVVGPIVCQVIDVDDIGQSRWSQVEAIEAKERGETTKGREIVRLVQQEDGDSVASVPPQHSKGPFKLLLQDANGLHVFALDLTGIQGLSTNMSMGCKILLKDFQVRRAVIMLEPSNVQVLGGKLEALDIAWKNGRKERLIKAAKAGVATTSA